MGDADDFIPHIWVDGVTSRKIVIQYIENEIAPKRNYNSSHELQIENGGLLLDSRKSQD